MNKSHLVDDISKWLNNLTEMFSAFSVWTKPEWRFHPGAEAVLKGFDVLAKVRLLAVMLFQFRFVIKQVEMTGCSTHEKLDNSLCLWWVMQHFDGRTDSWPCDCRQ